MPDVYRLIGAVALASFSLAVVHGFASGTLDSSAFLLGAAWYASIVLCAPRSPARSRGQTDCDA